MNILKKINNKALSALSIFRSKSKEIKVDTLTKDYRMNILSFNTITGSWTSEKDCVGDIASKIAHDKKVAKFGTEYYYYDDSNKQSILNSCIRDFKISKGITI